jgi:hypothetical protein
MKVPVHPAQTLACYSVEKWAERVDDIPDLGVPYRMNTFMVTGTQLVVRLVENIVNFHHGKPYLKQVNWGKATADHRRIARPFLDDCLIPT